MKESTSKRTLTKTVAESCFLRVSVAVVDVKGTVDEIRDLKHQDGRKRRRRHIRVKAGARQTSRSTRLSMLRTVPTIVIAHTFCASRDTRISYR